MRLISWFGVLLLSCLALSTSAPAAAEGDARVHVISPRTGQVFTPGATVMVTVGLQLPVTAASITIDVPGIGTFEGTNYNGVTYQASFPIPQNLAGPLTITPVITDNNGTTIQGVPVTIEVQPSTPPQSISLVTTTFMMNGPGESGNIYVRGEYPQGVERDLSLSATGTTYRSSDARVVKVDANGHTRATGFGTTVVMVENGGRKAFACFWVEDPAHPLPPVDVTPQVKVDRLPAQITPFDAYTSKYSQTLRIINAGPMPLPGRLYVVVSDLPPKTVITNAGRTKRVEPLGSPYYWAQLPDGLTLQPSQSASVKFEMWIASNQPVGYTVRVFRSSEEP